MNKLIENLIPAAFALFFIAVSLPSAMAQTPRPAPTALPQTPVIPAPPHSGRPTRTEAPAPAFSGGETTEKSLKVDSNLNLNLCILQGTVKINGWKRNELRVFIDDGSKFGLKVQEPNRKTGEPAMVAVEPVASKNKYASAESCLWGNEIEIDLPVNSTISIKGRETTTIADSIKKITIKTASGDVSLRNISAGIFASSNQGDITVEESEGDIDLNTTTGNILVFEAGPSEIGNMFKARTNSGSIALQGLEYRQVEVNSTSGSIAYTGQVLSGGSYTLFSQRGSIRMALPGETSCKVSATFRPGSFHSDIPYKLLTENVAEGPFKSIVASMGSGGDATVKLTTINGNINIKKNN